MNDKTVARLRITCPDKPGIVAAVSAFLAQHGANIVELDQHATGRSGGVLFMRLEFATPGPDINREQLERAFADQIAPRWAMEWAFDYPVPRKRMVILASRVDHCLLELLWRAAREELWCEIPMVISNHTVLRDAVGRFGVPFHHVPVDAASKHDAEARMLELMGDAVDLVVLARYMQIVSGRFIARLGGNVINIHHSFLPAFAGADPYRQAHARGVKLIGATAHYATEELDAGPIIEQDVGRVSHRDAVEDLKELGRDLERRVLASAVKAHLDDRIIVDGNKTVVF